MIDINALLATEGPSVAQMEADGKQLAEAKVLLKQAQILCEDVNILIEALCKRHCEVEVLVERDLSTGLTYPRPALIFLIAKHQIG